MYEKCEYSAFDCLNKHAKISISTKYSSEFTEIMEKTENFLVHQHAWARQSATKIFLTILSQVDIDELVSDDNKIAGYWNYRDRSRSLATRHIVQLKSNYVDRGQMEDNKNMILLLLKLFHLRDEKGLGDKDKKSDLLWFVQKLNSVAAFENSDK